jgi:hypothetical protein
MIAWREWCKVEKIVQFIRVDAIEQEAGLTRFCLILDLCGLC